MQDFKIPPCNGVARKMSKEMLILCIIAQTKKCGAVVCFADSRDSQNEHLDVPCHSHPCDSASAFPRAGSSSLSPSHHIFLDSLECELCPQELNKLFARTLK